MGERLHLKGWIAWIKFSALFIVCFHSQHRRRSHTLPILLLKNWRDAPWSGLSEKPVRSELQAQRSGSALAILPQVTLPYMKQALQFQTVGVTSKGHVIAECPHTRPSETGTWGHTQKSVSLKVGRWEKYKDKEDPGQCCSISLPPGNRSCWHHSEIGPSKALQRFHNHL